MWKRGNQQGPKKQKELVDDRGKRQRRSAGCAPSPTGAAGI